ncbi:hypothetical protein T11_376, partial [Trichinella zimbabwensis]
LGLLGSRDSLNVANFRKILKSRFSDFSWACWGPGTA